jgi:hypothetical protein
VACPIIYSSLAEGVKSFMSTGPAAALNIVDKEVVETTISRALQPFRVTDDFHFLHNQFLLFIAEK